MRKKIVFPLEQDEDGYPPVNIETVWAIPTEDGSYQIDNIPFFARGATLGDIVEVDEKDGLVVFASTLTRAGNSLVRMVVRDRKEANRVRAELSRLGCTSEWDETHGLIAVNIPANVELLRVQEYLGSGRAAGRWDYEEAILMQ